MPVYRGSRYDGVSTTPLTDVNNRMIRYLHNRTPLTQNDLVGPAYRYELRQGDDLDRLSFLRSGEERLWFLIAELNEVFWPFDLGPEDELLIPSEEDFSIRG